MNIQLSTGKTISISAYEYFFLLKEEDVEEFYRSCIADDLGTFISDPFSHRGMEGRIDVENIPEDELPDIDDFSI